MNTSLKNKIVLVTGASAGIGRAIAEQCAQKGARLILTARRFEVLEELKTQLERSYTTEVLPLCFDISKSQEAMSTFEELPAKWSSPDFVINNAGVARGLEPMWRVKPEEWDEVIDTNIKGVLATCRAFVPKMLERNSGHIINIGSIASHDAYPGGSVYCASKFAVKALTDTLRMELVATPLRISLISPGMVKTSFSDYRYYGDKQKAEAIYHGIEPLTAEDIAKAVLFVMEQPQHVNVADIVVYPTHQASPYHIHRTQ